MRFLCLLLALIGPAAFADEASSMSSIFLVARKDLPDPNFRDSVVLITHRGSAPVGVIINKPTKFSLGESLPDLEESPVREAKLYFGGPVNAQGVVGVFRAERRPDDSVEMLAGVYMSFSKEVLREVLGRKAPTNGVRVFAGHASWAPGQLEAEIARGDWHLARADAGTIFATKPETLWTQMERRASASKVRYLQRSTR
jgi:putative transcriptional regulator